MRAQLGVLAGSSEFLPWVRDNPAFKPRLSGLLSTAQGVHHVTILLDTGATHCFICARLAAALCPPAAVGPAGPALRGDGGRRRGAGAGNACANSPQPGRCVSRVAVDLADGHGRGGRLDPGLGLDLQHLFQTGQVGLRSGPEQLQLALLSAAARPPPAALSTVIGHGELRRRLRQIVRDDPPAASAAVAVVAPE
jgi:hypothetical protein